MAVVESGFACIYIHINTYVPIPPILLTIPGPARLLAHELRENRPEVRRQGVGGRDPVAVVVIDVGVWGRDVMVCGVGMHPHTHIHVCLYTYHTSGPSLARGCMAAALSASSSLPENRS